MGVEAFDVGVCFAEGGGPLKDALTVLMGNSPLNHNMPSVAPMPTNGTRINSAVIMRTVRAERLGLSESGFVEEMLSFSFCCAVWAEVPAMVEGFCGIVVGQAGVPGGK